METHAFVKKKVCQFVCDGESLAIWMMLGIYANEGLSVRSNKSAGQVSLIGRDANVQPVLFRNLFHGNGRLCYSAFSKQSFYG